MTSSNSQSRFPLPRILAFASALLLLGAGCETKPPNMADLPAPGQPQGPTMLVPGDVIGLAFSGAPDLNQTQKIRPDGKITLPLIGELTASGQTFPAFQQLLEAQYKSQLKNSDVTITLESSEDRTIIIDGSVQRPGIIPADRPLTAFEAIMLAGGFTDDADMKKVQVIRLVHGEHRSVFLDLRGAMHGAPTPAVPVEPGDIIFVPEKAF
jgi:polysaccharide export outer membrane protein